MENKSQINTSKIYFLMPFFLDFTKITDRCFHDCEFLLFYFVVFSIWIFFILDALWFNALLLFVSNIVLDLITCEPVGEICEMVWSFMESSQAY